MARSGDLAFRDESDNKFVDAAIRASAIIATYNARHFDSPDLPRHGWALMRPREFVARYLKEADSWLLFHFVFVTT